MSENIINTPSKFVRSTKKAMTYASQVGFSPNNLLKEQMQVSINKLQRSSSKVLTPKVEFNSAKFVFQQNEGEFVNYQYKKLKSLKIFEQKKEKIIQNSPLLFYLQDSKLQDNLETPSQKLQLDQTHEKIQLDFSKFYKNDKIAVTNLQQKQKKPINKQNLLEQIASYGLDNKLGFEQQKEQQRRRKPLQLQQLHHLNSSTNRYLNRVPSPFQNTLNQSPIQNKHQFQQLSLQRLIPIAQVQKKFISFKIRGDKTENIDPANQIRLEKTISFLEIKDKFFQISRLFQEKVDQELSNKESPILKLLVLKGYKPQNLCFYFSKLVENIVTNCSYPQEQFMFLNKQKKIITRKNSINLENQEDIEKTYSYNLHNQINNNTTNSSSSSKLTNNLTTNPSSEKDLNIHSAIYSNKTVSATKRVNIDKSKIDESVMQIHSLAHISSNLIDEIQFRTQPQIQLTKDTSQTAQQISHSLDLEEIANNEEEIYQKENIDKKEAVKEKFFTELENQRPDFTQENISFNLFFKIPERIYDELIQILSQILRNNVKNSTEINFLIKYLNDHKKEYTPQNLAEEFGSVDRIQNTAKFLLNKLISESIISNQFLDFSQEEEEILNFVNSLLNSDFKQLKYYSSLLNMNTKLSFAEFYLFKQLIHKQLLDILDRDERIYLLPQVMEKIEKSRNIFLIQIENQILNDLPLIKKIKSEIKMKFYIACPMHILESYFLEKMNTFSSNSAQTYQQNQNKNCTNSQQLLNNVQQLSHRYQRPQNSYILRDLNQSKEKQINNSAQLENSHDHDYLIFTPKNKNNFQNIQKRYFYTNKKFSFVSELFNNSQKIQTDVHYSPKHDNNQNINKAIQISYYEDLASFILENILLQQDLKGLIEGLKLRLAQLDFQILNFLQITFEEILTENQVQYEIIYDIKVRFNKVKFSLIENFKLKYESEEFRKTLKNYFTSIFENNLKANNFQLSHTKFFSAFDYIVYYYLSLNDIFSSYDFNFAIFISDSDETIIQIFKNSVIQTLKLVLPEQIISLIDLENLFLQ